MPALRVVLAVETVALTGFALARHPVPGGIALAVFAAGTVVWNSLWASYGQRQVPSGLLGRVGAAQRMVGLLTAPLGAALAGLAAAAYGTVPVAGAAAGTFALVTLAAWRTLRPADDRGVLSRRRGLARRVGSRWDSPDRRSAIRRRAGGTAPSSRSSTSRAGRRAGETVANLVSPAAKLSTSSAIGRCRAV